MWQLFLTRARAGCHKVRWTLALARPRGALASREIEPKLQSSWVSRSASHFSIIKKKDIQIDILLFSKSASRVPQGPVDLGSGTTEESFSSPRNRTLAAKQQAFEKCLALLDNKKRISNRISFFITKSARRGSNPRPPPWQGGAPPLSHSRKQNI